MVCKYFLLFCSCLSRFWWCPLKHRIFNFDEVQFIFSFVTWAFGVMSKTTQSHDDLRLCFLLRAKALTFRSMLHFKLVFMYGAKEESRFILFHVGIQLFYTIYWKEYFFPYWIVLAHLSISIDCKCKGLFLDSQFSSINLYFYSHIVLINIPLK